MPFASIYPLVTARAVARPFTYEVEDGVGPGAIVSMPFGRRRARGVVVVARGRAARGDRAGGGGARSSGRCRRRSSSSPCGSPTTTARRPARALALVAPELPKRRKEQAPPAERQSLGARPRPAELFPSSARRSSGSSPRSTRAAASRSCSSARPARGKTEVYLQACAADARAGPRRDRARAGDLADAADGGPRAGAVRRAGGDPALGADRGRAPGRARADRQRRGADRGRGALGRLRAGARPRPDRGRRGARRLLQAGLGPALRRPHARGEARRRSKGAVAVFGSATPRPESWAALERLELGGRVGGELPRVQRRRPPARGRLPALGAAARRAPAGGRERRQGDPAPQPARHRAGAPLPRLRRARSAARTATSRSSSTATGRCTAITAGTPSPSPTRAPPAARRRWRGSEPGRSGSSASSPRSFRSSSRSASTPTPPESPELTAAALAPVRRDAARGAARHADGREGTPLRGVELAAVVDADSALALPDFRAEERTFQLLTQLAGRSGRDAPGRVLVQTFQPDARPIAHAARHDVRGSSPRSSTRRAELGYPPARHLVRIVVSGPEPGAGRAGARPSSATACAAPSCSARRRCCVSAAATARS